MNGRSPAVTASLGFGMLVNSDRMLLGVARTVHGRISRILVVAEDAALRHLTMTRLRTEDYQVECAEDASAAIAICRRYRPNLVITDLRLQPIQGLALLAQLKSHWPGVSVIVLADYGGIPDAERATQSGAFGFLVKPIQKSELLGQARRAIAASRLNHTKADHSAEIASRGLLLEDRLVRANCAARSDVPVLLSGENGPGRELFARAIHAASSRRDNPFVVVRCAEAAEHLETELFGSAAGASEDDEAPGAGSLRKARGGTLLLDEIGELPMRLQIRLAAALREECQLRGRPTLAGHTDARLICASSVDLKEMVREGRLNDDLYYKIAIMPIEVPPLGRRREDIPLLVSSFLQQAATEDGTGKIYSSKALQLLVTADWPESVRQLFDVVRRNFALSNDRAAAEETSGSASTPGLSQNSRHAKRKRTDLYKLLSHHRLGG